VWLLLAVSIVHCRAVGGPVGALTGKVQRPVLQRTAALSAVITMLSPRRSANPHPTVFLQLRLAAIAGARRWSARQSRGPGKQATAAIVVAGSVSIGLELSAAGPVPVRRKVRERVYRTIEKERRRWATWKGGTGAQRYKRIGSCEHDGTEWIKASPTWHYAVDPLRLSGPAGPGYHSFFLGLRRRCRHRPRVGSMR